MKAVILAGGLGTRLRPATVVIPKPLIPIGDRSIIEISLLWLKTQGIEEVAVSLGWRGDLVKACLGDGSKYGVKLHYSQETEPLGTAGPLSLLKDWIGEDTAFVINGDILTQMNLEVFVKAFQSKRTIAVACRLHTVQSPFGEIVLAPGYTTLMEQINEKPVHSSLVSAGMYLIPPSELACIPKGKAFSMTELINDSASLRGKKPSVYKFTEPWIAVECDGDYNNAVNGEWLMWANSLEHRAMQQINTKTLEV